MLESILGLSVGISVGYWIGRENTIKFHRRLYNLNTNLNLLYAEWTEKDSVFNKVKNESIEPSNKLFGIK